MPPSRGDGRDRYEPRADWGQGRDRDQTLDRSAFPSGERSRERFDDRQADRSFERSSDWSSDRSADWASDRSADWASDRSADRSFEPPGGRSADWASERSIDRPGDGSQERWDPRQRDRDFDASVDRPRDRRPGPDGAAINRSSWAQQPASPYGSYPERDLDPYAGEGGANPSYGQRRGESMPPRPRPPQDDPWAED